jgi:hypothetical protein
MKPHSLLYFAVGQELVKSFDRVRVVADVHVSSATVRRAGAFEGPGHASLLGALLGVFQLAVSNHGGDGLVATFSKALHEASINVWVHPGGPAAGDSHGEGRSHRSEGGGT